MTHRAMSERSYDGATSRSCSLKCYGRLFVHGAVGCRVNPSWRTH